MKLSVFGVVGLVFGMMLGIGVTETVLHQKTTTVPIAQSYTPSTAPVFTTQLHTNVIVSANGGRTVFVTR